MDHLSTIYEEASPDADRRAIAKQYFDDEYMFQAGRFVIQAWLFRGRDGWNETLFEEALNAGAMTVYLASPDALRQASAKYRRRMATNRVPTSAAE